MTSQTLTEALAAIGISHQRAKIVDKQDLFTSAGDLIAAHDVAEGWEFVRAAQAAA